MREILKEAISRYGDDMQITVAIEELSELTKELCKYKRGEGKKLNIAEEMADVRIMLDQLEIIFDNSEDVQDWYKYKVNRLKSRMAIEYRAKLKEFGKRLC